MMTRKKSRLSLHKPKVRRNTESGIKRKHATPSKSDTQIRSPYKSPLYRASPGKSPLYSASPLKKRFKKVQARTQLIYSSETTNENVESMLDFGFLDQSTENDDSTEVLEQINELLPSVVRILSMEKRLDRTILNFFKQVKDGIFPLNNISLLLFADTVKWFDNDSTIQMRYPKETKTFWKLGYRLFGERFVNFMSGPKSQGDTVMNVCGRGQYSPRSADINFAVPNPKILRSFNPYDVTGERKPGIYGDIMAVLAENLRGKSACLTFDGKKIKQGLTEEFGDVDLLGFEKDMSLSQKRDKLQQDKKEVADVITNLSETSLSESLDSLTDSDKVNVKAILTEKLRSISVGIFKATDLKSKKEYCMQKLIERGGSEDWRKSKYVYAISAVKAFIYDIEQFTGEARELTEEICNCLAVLNQEIWTNETHINLKTTDKFYELPHSDEEKIPRLVKQRSEEWNSIRAKAKVTGSTLFNALGFAGLARQKDHFDKVICSVPEKAHSDEVKAAMQHGIDNEENAIGTIVAKVLPVLEPGLIFCEEGCVDVKNENGDVFLVVSPDGSLRRDQSLQSTCVGIEIKCPVSSIHTEIPYRYYLQCLSEIEVLDVEYLLYVCWTNDETTVFRVSRDTECFKKAMKIALELYDMDDVKRPLKLTDEQLRLKEIIQKKSKSVPLIARFQSVKVSDCQNGNAGERSDTEYSVGSLVKLLENINRLTKDFYEVNRERASEAVVFLVADLDRSWQHNQIRCAPVSWFPKGYSLSTDTMRQIYDQVHDECHSFGIHIPCVSFDGQWHNMVARSIDGKPLTLYQLQKDGWHEASAMKKKDIVNEIKKLNKNPSWQFRWTRQDNETKENTLKRVIHATSGITNIPVLRLSRLDVVSETKESDAVESTVEGTLGLSIPAIVQESSSESEHVMALAAIESIEEEVFSCNVDENLWAFEVESLQFEQSGIENDMHDDSDTPSIDQNSRNHKESTLDLKGNVVNKLNPSTLQLHDMLCILNLLKKTKDCNKGNKWNSVSPEKLLTYFEDSKTLMKFVDVELRVIVRYLKRTTGCTIKESISKREKVRGICKLLSLDIDGLETKTSTKRGIKCVKSLSELCTEKLSKCITKNALNIAYAELIWNERYQKWISEVQSVKVNNDSYEWFYKPEYSNSRQQYEVRCIDSTHLMTRARRNSCKGNLDGLSKESWLKVAKTGKTFLTRIMVDEITDPMSISMATTHFSEAVENAMRGNGDLEAANLCNDLRKWWESEDKPGLCANTRHLQRQFLKERLLKNISFGTFPPPTSYVRGWPIQLWEALLASIDAKVWLFCICETGSYNVRAFSSMIGETYFAELVLNDRRGQGTVSCKEFGQFVGNTIEQLQIRLDPDRVFSYKTSGNTVYNYVEKADKDEAESTGGCKSFSVLPGNIITRNHPFDSKERARLSGKMRYGTVKTDRNALQKGSLGVRWEGARTNQSKMLPSTRMGIDD